jgi:hypothetical protein
MNERLNKTLETNCAPPLCSTLGGNSGVPFTLDVAFPAAAAHLGLAQVP